MMSDQYQQTFTTTDGQNNVTYIQFVNPSQSQILYCKEEINDQEYCYDDNVEETLEESYIEEDPIDDTIEILESVVVERKKNNSRATTSSDHQVTKKLVQVTGMLMILKSTLFYLTKFDTLRFREAKR